MLLLCVVFNEDESTPANKLAGYAEVVAKSPVSLVGAQMRPYLVAILAVCMCLLLFRPRRTAIQRPPSCRPVACRPLMSVATVGTLVEFEGGRVPRMLTGAAEALRKVAERADVYLVTTLPEDSDHLEAATLQAMGDGMAFVPGSCEQCKAIFCSTEDGRSAIVRQLAPAVHLDTSPKVLQYLAPHVRVVDSGGRLPADLGELLLAHEELAGG